MFIGLKMWSDWRREKESEAIQNAKGKIQKL
jgi:hypothetical protein